MKHYVYETFRLKLKSLSILFKQNFYLNNIDNDFSLSRNVLNLYEYIKMNAVKKKSKHILEVLYVSNYLVSNQVR